MTVAINTTTAQGGHAWVSQLHDYFNLGFFEANTRPGADNGPFEMRDVNRDGLPDLVHDDFFRYPDGSVAANEIVLMNQGADATNNTSFRFDSVAKVHSAPPGGTQITLDHSRPSLGDIDGDGFYDAVDYESETSQPGYAAGVGFGDGTGTGFANDPNLQQYLNVLKADSPSLCSDFDLGCGSEEDYGFALVDIDGDGLVDLVRNHQNRLAGPSELNEGGGEILFNTGMTWLPIGGGTASWDITAGRGRIPAVVPSVATENAASAFVDLDGDGMPDIVQGGSDNGLTPVALINPYQRPVILRFPNGLAQVSNVTYVSTSSALGASTYQDDDTTEANTKVLVMPVTVVSTVDAEDQSGTGTRDVTTYTYHSLRQDSFGRGPLGFHRVEMLNQASQVRTTTTYALAFPYTGMPTEVDKYQVIGSQSHLTNQTTTSYCSKAFGCGPPSPGQPPTGTIVFAYPSMVTDVAYLHPEADDLASTTTITTTFQFDALGNGTDTNTQITKAEGGQTETFGKDVQNFYDLSEAQNEGKPTKTTTTATGGTGPTTHTTTFEYLPVSLRSVASGSRLAAHQEARRTGRRMADSSSIPAYAYDQFGNVDDDDELRERLRASCASRATNGCRIRQRTPQSDDPVHHPPFRTTTRQLRSFRARHARFVRDWTIPGQDDERRGAHGDDDLRPDPR